MPLLEIRRGEHLRLLGAFFTLFGIVAAHTIAETARDALFLSRLPATRLPLAYFGVALGAFLLGNVSTLLVWRLGRRDALVALLVAGAGVTIALAGFLSPARPWLLHAVYVWTGVLTGTAVVAFWLLASDVFTVAQGKRLFPALAAGASLGALAGAGAAALLARWMPAARLLALGGALQLLTGLASLVLPRTRGQGCLFCPGRNRESLADGMATLRSHPYLQRLGALVALAAVTSTLVDYRFKAAVAAAVPPARLGEFFGLSYAALAGLALVAQALAGPLVRVRGIAVAVGALPAMLLLGSPAAGLGGLAAALALRGVDGALRPSLHRVGVELAYMPLSVELRDRVKALVDGVLARAAQAAAAALLLAAAALSLDTPGALALGIAAGAAGSLALARGLRRPYLDLFRKSLATGRIDTRLRFPALDVLSLEALLAALNSPDDRVVNSALELLAAQRRHKAIPALILYHHSPAVLLRALEVLGASGRRDFVPLCDRLLGHADAAVRAAAVRAKLAVAAAGEELRALASDPSPAVRALVAVALGDARLIEQAASGPPEARAAVVEVTTDAELVLRLAHTSSPEVLRAVAGAAVRLGDRRPIPALIARLGVRAARPAVRAALVALGEPALAALEAALDDPALDLAARRHVPRTISQFGGARAAAVLARRLEARADGVIRYKLLRGLGRMVADRPDLPLDRGPIEAAARATADKLHRYLAWRLALERGQQASPGRATDCGRLLCDLLADKHRLGFERLFRLLALLHPRERLIDAYAALTEGDARARAAALEVVGGLLRGGLRDAVLSLCEDPNDGARQARAAARVGASPARYQDLLRAMLESGKRTLAALTARHAAELGLGDLAPASMPPAPAPPAAALEPVRAG